MILNFGMIKIKNKIIWTKTKVQKGTQVGIVLYVL